jgi:hypothetical protein
MMTTNHKLQMVGIVFLGLAGVLMLSDRNWGVGDYPEWGFNLPQPPIIAPAKPAKPSTYAVKDVVRRSLKDPDSAQFGNIWFVPNPYGSGQVACGFVNARNFFGGYVGFQTFLVVVAENGELSPAFSQGNGFGYGSSMAAVERSVVTSVCGR